MKQFMKKAAFWSVIGLGLIGVGMIFATFSLQNSVQAEVIRVPQAVDHTPRRILELKKDLVARLMACESAGHKEEDAIIIYDNNKAGTLKGKTVFSLGQLQWKVSTIQHYVNLRDNKQITQKEAVLLALDTDQASELALWTIFETEGGVYNWKNCSDKHGLAAEVTILKKLSK